MPGANYMGGKRNVMKARTKDTVGRQQKGFFGRKRLDMLAKGFSSSKNADVSRSPPNFPVSKQKGRQDITLAHARGQQLEDDSDDFPLRRYIPSPIHVSNSSPRSKKRLRTNQAHTSSSEIGKSVILDTLDTTEPLFLRMVMDRILAMPDLAALNSVKERQSSPVHSRKRKRTPSDIGDAEGNGSGSVNQSSSRFMQAGSPTRNKSHLSDVDKEDDEDKQNYKIMDEDIQDSGYAESCDALIDDLDSEWSVQEPWSSPGDIVEQHEVEPSSDSMNSFRQHTRQPASQVMLENPARAIHIVPKDANIVTIAGLPSVVDFGDAIPAQGAVYGTLFDQEDPWRTIGTILGIEDAQSSADTSVAEIFYQEKDAHGSFLLEEFAEEELSDEDMNRFSLQDPPSTCASADGQRASLYLFKTSFKEHPSEPDMVYSLPSEVETEEKVGYGEGMALQVDIRHEEVMHPVEAHLSPVSNEARAEITELLSPEKEDLLGLPELQEVNGLYLGPSLFGNLDMEESDEEDAD